MELLRFDAELGEDVSQGLLGDGKLSELTGQRLSQLGHVIVTLPIVSEQLQPRLELQVHRPGAAAELLRQRLPGALRRRRQMFTDQLLSINNSVRLHPLIICYQ